MNSGYENKENALNYKASELDNSHEKKITIGEIYKTEKEVESKMDKTVEENTIKNSVYENENSDLNKNTNASVEAENRKSLNETEEVNKSAELSDKIKNSASSKSLNENCNEVEENLELEFIVNSSPSFTEIELVVPKCNLPMPRKHPLLSLFTSTYICIDLVSSLDFTYTIDSPSSLTSLSQIKEITIRDKRDPQIPIDPSILKFIEESRVTEVILNNFTAKDIDTLIDSKFLNNLKFLRIEDSKEINYGTIENSILNEFNNMSAISFNECTWRGDTDFKNLEDRVREKRGREHFKIFCVEENEAR